MNSTSTNVGGWPASGLHTFANREFFNKLPSDLQNVIIDTKVISGYGSSGENNFISTDKIYLLSAFEVLKDATAGDVKFTLNRYETIGNLTRQLDYYNLKGVERGISFNTNNIYALKRDFGGEIVDWWLRSSASYGIPGIKNEYQTSFLTIHSYTITNENKNIDIGEISYADSINVNGFAPAFRIG